MLTKQLLCNCSDQLSAGVQIFQQDFGCRTAGELCAQILDRSPHLGVIVVQRIGQMNVLLLRSIWNVCP